MTRCCSYIEFEGTERDNVLVAIEFDCDFSAGHVGDHSHTDSSSQIRGIDVDGHYKGRRGTFKYTITWSEGEWRER